MSKTGFAKATGIMMVAILFSRVLGLFREAVIAAQFGQSMSTDIYKAAFKLPDTLYFMLAGGALNSAFIPVFSQYLAQDKREEAWKVYSTITTLMGIIIVGLIIAGEVFARQLVPLLAWGFEPEMLDHTAQLTRIVLPAQFFFFIGALTMGTLYARNRFLIPSLGPIIYNLGIIFGGLVLTKRMGLGGLCWGALAGAFLGNFLLQLVYSSRLGMTFRPSLDLKHPGVKKVFIMMLPVILGLSLPQVDVIINTAFASLLEKGAYSAVDNANRLMQLPLGVFGQAAGTAALPTLAALVARAEWKEYRETISFGLRSVFFGMIPAGLLMIVLARPIIAFVLQAGKFSAHDTALTATALVFYCVGVFAWGGQAIVARGFYALQDSKTPVIIGTIMTVFFVPLNWILLKAIGIGGLSLATSIAAIAHLAIMTQVLARRVGGIGAWRILRSMGLITAAAGLASVAAGLTSRGALLAIGHQGGMLGQKAAALAQIVPSLAVAAIVYIVVCRLLGVEELATLARMLRRRPGGGAPAGEAA